jgi:Txe/YoeB family toxin of Txe-Axe toxin-antitoxin module
VTSRTSSHFREDLKRMPAEVRRQARQAYRLFSSDPYHSSLRFKKLPPHDDIWSARINAGYRAVGRREGDAIVWFFIGSHADYDRLLSRL